MGYCCYCKQNYRESTNTDEMPINRSDCLREISQDEYKPENKVFFNLNNQK